MEISDYITFKKNVNEWIKELHSQITEIKDNNLLIQQIDENTYHNYELIKELRFEIEELKHEINAMKIIQIAINRGLR